MALGSRNKNAMPRKMPLILAAMRADEQLDMVLD